MFRTLVLIFILLVAILRSDAQCTFDLGNDTIICAGSNLALNSIAGMDSYNWNTSATTQGINVSTSGIYTCDVSLLLSGINLVNNGNFSAGNTGFTSAYTYNAGGGFGPTSLGATYFVTNDPALAHSNYNSCPDHTTGTGNMMVTNGDTLPGNSMWCQTIAVTPNTNYQFGYWLQSVIGASPARLQVTMNGIPLGAVFTAPGVVCNWIEFSDTWNSGAVTSVDICIENMNTDDGGNDYAIDDVYLHPYCEYSDAITVTVQAIPVPNLGPDQQICPWDSVLLDVTTPGATYLWSTGATTASIYAGPPISIYSVQVTVNGCTGSDNINITPYGIMPLDLGPDTVLCDGTPLVLSSNITGATYMWNLGFSSAAIPISTSGTYWLDATSFGCTQSDTINVTFNPNPTVNIGGNTNICEYDSILLDASTAGATYLWSTGNSSATQWALPDSNYSVNISVNGCLGWDTISIGSLATPVVDLGLDSAICPWDSVLLDATVAGGSYLWNTGATSSSIYASAAGPYWVQVSVNGCVNADTMQLSHLAYPGVDIGPDVSICPGATTAFSNSIAASSQIWNTSSTANTLIASTQGWYWMDATTNGCTQRDSAYVTFLPVPVVNIGADTSICADQQFILDATQPGGTYVWSTGSTASSITAVADSSYWVDVTVNGCTASDTIVVGSFALPTVLLGADTSVCPGVSILLDASTPGATYLWQDGSSNSSYSAAPTSSNWVQVTDANGCLASDTILVSSAPVPTVNLGPDIVQCLGDSTLVDATTAGATYQWNNGLTTASQYASSAGIYTVVVNLNGCTASDTIEVSFFTPPALNLGNDTTLCPGANLLLDASLAGASYSWQNGSPSSSYNVSSTGSYYVTITDAQNCTNSDTINVSYITSSAINLGNDTTVCPGASITLDASVSGGWYQWSTGAFTPTVTITQPDTIWVNIAISGCQITDTMILSNFVVNQINLGPDTSICPGDQILLDATTAGANYVWQDGSNNATFLATGGNNYSVTVIDANGCYAADLITVSNLNLNPVNLGPDIILCAGDSITLDGTTAGASSYQWNTGPSQASITVNSSNTYILSVSQGGCVVTDTVVVTVLPFPQVNLGPDVTLCPGDSMLLDATWVGASYNWSTGASTPSIYASSAGTYWVTVDVNGCVDQDTIQINYATPFVLDLGNDTTLCPGQTLTLSANTSGTNLWSTGSPASSITVSTANTYWLTSTVGNCSQSDTIVVNYVNTGALNLGPDIDMCFGDTAVLDASNITGGTFLWQDGSSDPTFAAVSTGLYWVQIDIGACTISDSINVAVHAYPVLSLGADTSLCAGDSLNLSVVGVTGAVSWWNASTSVVQTVAAGGTYWVEVNNNGCIVNDTISISANPLPPLNLGNDTLLCAGAQLLLSAPAGMSSYLWNTSSNSSSLLISSAGTYYVDSYLNGCFASDTITVSYLQAGAVSLGPDSTICPGSSITLYTGLSGANYLWSNNSSADSLVVNAAGTVWVTATISGCSESDTVNISVEPLATPNLINDTLICEGDEIIIRVDPNGADVMWNTSSTLDSIVVDQAGVYAVQLLQNGCMTTDTVVVSLQNFLDTLDVGSEFLTCAGTPIVVDATTAGASYLWSNGSSNSFTQFDQAGVHWVEISGFCIAASDTFIVSTEDCTPLLFVPNTFTPDGDGINDVFSWPWWGDLTRVEVSIFNRWGELLFESEDPNGFWDGNYAGRPVQDGVYAYLILYSGFNSEGIVQGELLGHVNVIR